MRLLTLPYQPRTIREPAANGDISWRARATPYSAGLQFRLRLVDIAAQVRVGEQCAQNVQHPNPTAEIRFEMWGRGDGRLLPEINRDIRVLQSVHDGVEHPRVGAGVGSQSA